MILDCFEYLEYLVLIVLIPLTYHCRWGKIIIDYIYKLWKNLFIKFAFIFKNIFIIIFKII